MIQAIAPVKLWLILDEMKKLPTETKITISVLAYIFLFTFFNYYSNGSLMIRFYDEYELHQKNCMTRHGDWSPSRGICRFMGYTICPLLFSATLLVILIFEYTLEGIQDGLRFLCGSWCIAKMSNK